MLGRVKERRFTLDGELIIPAGRPSRFRSAADCAFTRRESRVRKLVEGNAGAAHAVRRARARRAKLGLQALVGRRRALEKFYQGKCRRRPPALSRNRRPRRCPRLAEAQRRSARRCRRETPDQPYRFGERAMVKVKQLRTADCVVGGFRYAEKKHEVGSLLLGLYDDEGLLHHVGFTSGIPAKERPELTKTLGRPDRSTRLYRQRAGRSEPLEHRAHRPMGAVEAEARGRGPLRPGHRPPIPPRHGVATLAARQGAQAMHVRATCSGAEAIRDQGIVRRSNAARSRRDTPPPSARRSKR